MSSPPLGPNCEAAIWARLTQAQRDEVSPKVAEYLLSISFGKSDRDRMQHLAERSFCVQDNAFVLMGWPADSLAGADMPLDELRREMSTANVRHKYHARATDVDNDLYLVVGHHTGAPADALARATAAVRDKLAADPVDLTIGLTDVKIVAADSHTLAPPLFVGDIPAPEASLLALIRIAAWRPRLLGRAERPLGVRQICR